jgi:aspartate/methionine/tyrosine aminotransferase
MSALPSARNVVRDLRASKIREVANAAMGHPEVLPFWFGEPDEVTPDFIRQAAIEALNSGDTFYTHNLGIPRLREAIAGYVSRLHRPIGAERVAVTNSGMSALMLATQALVGPGDRVVEVTPLWPNLVEIPKVLGAQVQCIPLRFDPQGWRLDVDELLSALTPGTRALYINSPNNPTGWTIARSVLRPILDHCRRYGIWVVADDAYERLYFGAPDAPADGVAPSFLDIADPEDRVVSTNTFSKAWLMTGWRLGWLVAPAALIPELAKLIEYNTSCAQGFVQRAGIAAITHGETTIARFVARLRAARDLLVPQLRALPGVEAAFPTGAMYAFFRVAGVDDSLAFCKHLVVEAKLGLAPGAAFGPEGEGFVRWCFAAAESRLIEGVARLTDAVTNTR